MTTEQTPIWQYLVVNALGRSNAKNVSTIAGVLGLQPHGTNNDDVRAWIRILLRITKK